MASPAAIGQDDVFAVIDLPDAAAAAALSVNMNQTGRITARTILLMTPEEMDAALKKTVQYRANIVLFGVRETRILRARAVDIRELRA
jgi:hypothetical protein